MNSVEVENLESALSIEDGIAIELVPPSKSSESRSGYL